MKQIKCTLVGNLKCSVAFLCSSLNGIVPIVLHRKLKLLQNAEVSHRYCTFEFITFWFSKQN